MHVAGIANERPFAPHRLCTKSMISFFAAVPMARLK
jgi:hypothetical protein